MDNRKSMSTVTKLQKKRVYLLCDNKTKLVFICLQQKCHWAKDRIESASTTPFLPHTHPSS